MRKEKYIKHNFFGIWGHFMKANGDQSLQHDYLQLLFKTFVQFLIVFLILVLVLTNIVFLALLRFVF